MTTVKLEPSLQSCSFPSVNNAFLHSGTRVSNMPVPVSIGYVGGGSCHSAGKYLCSQILSEGDDSTHALTFRAKVNLWFQLSGRETSQVWHVGVLNARCCVLSWVTLSASHAGSRSLRHSAVDRLVLTRRTCKSTKHHSYTLLIQILQWWIHNIP
jgi:hypothetical protein